MASLYGIHKHEVRWKLAVTALGEELSGLSLATKDLENLGKVKFKYQLMSRQFNKVSDWICFHHSCFSNNTTSQQ